MPVDVLALRRVLEVGQTKQAVMGRLSLCGSNNAIRVGLADCLTCVDG